MANKYTIFSYDCHLNRRQYLRLKEIGKQMPKLTIDIVNQDAYYWIVSIKLNEDITTEEVHRHIAVLLNAALTTGI